MVTHSNKRRENGYTGGCNGLMDLLKASLPANAFFGNEPEMGPTVSEGNLCG